MSFQSIVSVPYLASCAANPLSVRWDPLTKDNVQFFQASLLYCTYYHVQIQIHRPFIIKSSPLTFPSKRNPRNQFLNSPQ